MTTDKCKLTFTIGGRSLADDAFTDRLIQTINDGVKGRKADVGSQKSGGKGMEKDVISNEEATSKILMILSRHVGQEKSVDMGSLYERVFDKPYTNKINHTRRLRTIITALRQKGIPIGSTAATNGGGYYIVRAGSELDEYCGRLRRAALNKLAMEARLRKISMEELLGQMKINFTAEIAE